MHILWLAVVTSIRVKPHKSSPGTLGAKWSWNVIFSHIQRGICQCSPTFGKCFTIHEDRVSDLLKEVKWLTEWYAILKLNTGTLPAQEAPSTTQSKQLFCPVAPNFPALPTNSIHPTSCQAAGTQPERASSHSFLPFVQVSAFNLSNQFGTLPLDEGHPARPVSTPSAPPSSAYPLPPTQHLHLSYTVHALFPVVYFITMVFNLTSYFHLCEIITQLEQKQDLHCFKYNIYLLATIYLYLTIVIIEHTGMSWSIRVVSPQFLCDLWEYLKFRVI